MNTLSFDTAITIMRNGGVGIIPTDTLYGVVASAFSKEAVERVYAVRGRSEHKPCIVLLPNEDALALFGIVLTEKMRAVVKHYWPGAVSIVMPCDNEHFAYLHRGTKTLAFRVPDPRHADLVSFLKKTGPIIAPSANIQGKPPATTIPHAYEYFLDTVDFYVDGGVLTGEPSTIVSVCGNEVQLVRQGVVPFTKTELKQK